MKPLFSAIVICLCFATFSFAQSVESNDPSAPHDSGIYLYSNGQMTMLEPAAYQGHKMGVGVPVPYMPIKMRAVIQGTQASIRTNEASPVFYFYFDSKQGGLGRGGFGTTSSPNQYALVRLEVKKADRETVIFKENAFGGSSSGTNGNINFRFERLRPGVYKVFPTGMLERGGEYCFMSSYAGQGAAIAADIFDFGIN